MPRKAVEITLSKNEENELLAMKNRPSTQQRYIPRIKIILLAAKGLSNKEIIAGGFGNKDSVRKWRNRYAKLGIEGLDDFPRSGRPQVLSKEDEEKLLSMVLSKPPEAITHWSTRLLESVTGFSRPTINRTLNRHGIKPHAIKSFKYSKDPNLVEKVVDIVGLYLNPPEKAFVISIDEKTQIQALDRTQTVLPVKPGSPERHTHDYVRHGTTALFAALEVSTGEVIGECRKHHKSVDFHKFLKKVRRNWPYKKLHIICDNLSTHKTDLINDWLEKNKRITIHYTPTSASWMNQIEIWFSILQRQALSRGRHGSVEELMQKIQLFIDNWNERKHPFKWRKTSKEILEKAIRQNTND